MRIFPVEDNFERAVPPRADRHPREVGVVSGASHGFPAGPEAQPSSPASRLLVCVGPRCDAQGRGRGLLAALREELAANPDAAARVEVTTRDCLRGCTRDPVVRLEPSGDLFSDPTVEELLRAAGAVL